MHSLTRAARHRVLRGMNDTVRAMRWCGWLLVAACSRDPSLAVTVHHPAGYAVTQTRVTVYVGVGVQCSAIELGDFTEAELGALSVSDAIDGGEIEVSRLGEKAIVARGYDAQGRFVTAGCQDVGEIAGATTVAISTQPTASIAIDPGQPDRPFSEREILVNMTDLKGKVLDGTVSWQLTGPGGTMPQMASAGVPTRNGNLRFQVADIGQPGPEGLRIRAPWATAPLPLVTAFDLSHATTIQLGGGAAASHPSCDIRGHAGKPPTLVCLTQANVIGHRDAVEISSQGGPYVPAAITIPAGIDNEFALFVDHDGSADEPVYVLAAAAGGAGSWYRLGAASGTPVTFAAALQNVVYVLSASAAGTGSWYKLGAPSGTTETFASALQNVVYIPKCADNANQALVAVQTGTVLGVANQVRIFTVAGAALGSAPTDGEVFSGGCLHDVDRKEHQGVVVAGAGGDAGLQLITPGSQTLTPIMSEKFTGSGFVTIESQGVIEKRFAGTRLQATGTVVFESVLAPQGSSYMLVERTEVEAAAPPEKIIAGKLDLDSDTDLMWDMGIGARRRVFQVSLAEQVGGVPLTAMTSGPGGGTATAANPTDFVVGDLNGKGADEMILFTQSAVTIYSPDE